MKLRSLLKGAMLVTVSALLIAIVTLLGLVALEHAHGKPLRHPDLGWNGLFLRRE